MRVLLVIAIALGGCDNKQAGEEEALKFVSDTVTTAIPKIEAAIAPGGRPSDGMFECVYAANNDTLIKAGGRYAEMATKIARLCEHDVPIAMIKKSVVEAEADRAANPKDTMPTKCVINEVGLALKQLKNRDDAKELLARFAAACPDEKL